MPTCFSNSGFALQSCLLLHLLLWEKKKTHKTNQPREKKTCIRFLDWLWLLLILQVPEILLSVGWRPFINKFLWTKQVFVGFPLQLWTDTVPFFQFICVFLFNCVEVSNVHLQLLIREQIVIHHGSKIELILFLFFCWKNVHNSGLSITLRVKLG